MSERPASEIQRQYYAETADRYDSMHVHAGDEHYFALEVMLAAQVAVAALGPLAPLLQPLRAPESADRSANAAGSEGRLCKLALELRG